MAKRPASGRQCGIMDYGALNSTGGADPHPAAVAVGGAPPPAGPPAIALDPGLPIKGEIEILGVPVTAVFQSVTSLDRLPLPGLSPGYRYQKKFTPTPAVDRFSGRPVFGSTGKNPVDPGCHENGRPAYRRSTGRPAGRPWAAQNGRPVVPAGPLGRWSAGFCRSTKKNGFVLCISHVPAKEVSRPKGAP